MLPAEARRAPRPARPAPRPLKRSVAALAIALAAVGVGCGADDDEPTEPSAESTALVVTLDADGVGGKPPSDAELICPEQGSGGSAAAACAAAAGLTAGDADPVPSETPCTEIYGGPDLVALAGMLNGEQIDARLSRADGCEIERFGRFVPLLETLFGDYRPGAELKG